MFHIAGIFPVVHAAVRSIIMPIAIRQVMDNDAARGEEPNECQPSKLSG